MQYGCFGITENKTASLDKSISVISTFFLEIYNYNHRCCFESLQDLVRNMGDKQLNKSSNKSNYQSIDKINDGEFSANGNIFLRPTNV